MRFRLFLKNVFYFIVLVIDGGLLFCSINVVVIVFKEGGLNSNFVFSEVVYSIFVLENVSNGIFVIKVKVVVFGL